MSDQFDSLLRQYSSIYAPLITLEEAAKIARVPIKTVYTWSSQQLLDAFKSKRGRRVLLRRDGFVRFVIDELND